MGGWVGGRGSHNVCPSPQDNFVLHLTQVDDHEIRCHSTEEQGLGCTVMSWTLMDKHLGMITGHYWWFLAVPLRREGQLYRWPRH